MHHRPKTLLAAIVIAALGLAGASCGDDDDEAEDGQPTSTDGGTSAPATTAGTDDSAVTTTVAPQPDGTEPDGADDDDPSQSTEPPATMSPSPSDDPARLADRDAEFRFALSSGLTSFDPHRSPVAGGDQIFMRPVYDSLLTMALDDDGRLQLSPRLATAYEVADDGLSITFTLRDDATFQDGTPFDAAAVQANIERALDPESTVSSLIASIASVDVITPTEVVFHLEQPDPAVVWAMAFSTTGMMVSPAAFANPDLDVNPVGTGPFQVVSAQKDANVVYERWDGHWDPDAALVRQLTISTLADGNTRYNGVLTGDLDAAYVSPPHDDVSRDLVSDGFAWEQRLSPTLFGVLLNPGRAPFDDVRVRRAVSLAVDRVTISETLLNGINPPAFQMFSKGYLGHDPELDVDTFDLDAARALVEEAGAAGTTVQIANQVGQPSEAISQVLQEVLGDIGLTVELTALTGGEARAAWRTGDYDGLVGPIIAQVDPSSTLNNSFLGIDNPGGAPPELVEMAEAALVIADPDERAASYQAISAYLVENPIHVPIVSFSTVILAAPHVVGSENILVTGLGDIDFRHVGVVPS